MIMKASHGGNREVETNYFVCTLGQAAAINKGNPNLFETISEFIDHQAQQYPTRPAVGFPISRRDANEEWGHTIYTFQDLRDISTFVGRRIGKSISPSSENKKTVALLCPSSILFLVHWLALMRLGYSVLLIAPQCEPSAILHLCRECNVSKLFFDDAYTELAKDACQRQGAFVPMQRLSDIGDGCSLGGETAGSSSLHNKADPLFLVSGSDVAYLHHTSGTSSGLPKPIPQTHHAAVGVLPTLNHGHDKATFTTTPLYHGGVADCFRAWTSGAMVWLFPGADVPITAANVLKSLQCARTATLQDHVPNVAYFSSVPYIMQMMAADHEGLRTLKQMDLVGVGGAALPQEAGDDLVAKGVNLLSRFGSAECGFLMSSHRDYSIDKEWQYLRSNGSSSLKFELQEGGLAELVILPTWPHMAKRNRGDGSYATADLFEPHSTILDAWKYHSRADSQLTLITGKKFDPAPLEAAIAASPLVRDVLIFGNGRQYPGALLFRSTDSIGMRSEDFLEALWRLIEKLNAEGQGHTRLSRSMLAVMSEEAPGLEKSSKGTVMRGQAEKSYAAEINAAYKVSSTSLFGRARKGAIDNIVPDEDVPVTVLQIIKGVINTQDPIPSDADLFSFGVDSVACMQIRALSQNKLLPRNSISLPLNVVYDCGTIRQLSKYLISIRKGQNVEKEDEIMLMRDLVGEYSVFHDTAIEPSNIHGSSLVGGNTSGETIILTGATGALGAHILALLQNSPRVSQIHCLVRAASEHAARERVYKSLRARKKEISVSSTEGRMRIRDSKIVCYPCKLSDPLLGLSKTVYRSLADNTTIIIHAAWAVNFSMRLPSFVKDHISGLRNLMSLAIASPNVEPPRFIFCSSTASVICSHTTSPISETITNDPLSASPLGYSRSKWVAESICQSAHLNSRMHGNIAVLRIGQLCGDTRHGIWNKSEAWPLMLSSVKATGSLPDLKETLNWLPVDSAAEAVLDIAFVEKLYQPQGSKIETPVYHILNPSTQTNWSDLLRWMHDLAPGFETLAPADWVSRLENVEGKAADHPAKKLLGLWRDAYCKADKAGEAKDKVTFEMEKTKRISPAMRDVNTIDEEMFGKLWTWIEQIDSDHSD
jgi:thioester reductase-like protein